MKASLIKKSFSLILALLMLFTAVPATVFAAEESYPTMMQFTAASSGDFHKYYNKVYSVTFLDEIDTQAMNGALEKWDISANAGSGEVMSWMYRNEEASAAAGADRYDVYIAGEGGVGANPQSGFIFYLFTELVEVNGSENLKTDNATTFKSMFENCSKLSKVSFKGWNTENVVSMENMFRNCHVLTELDLSSFNTSKVTTMRFMFYLCKKLKNIYVGDGWTTESIANLYDGVFNCCYAIIGGTDDDAENQKIYESNPNPPVSGLYAELQENGGYLTYKAPEVTVKYNVTYEFVGDVIPDGVVAPEAKKYEEGSTAAVEGNPSAEGYVFSGWSTTDATVTDGSFTVNNDVHFVGSWTKLYKVEYKYAEGFMVPEGAPELPAPEYFAPGTELDRYGVPYVNEYIFVGWTSDDVEVVGDMYDMPENDVTFYGFFKKPVESVEFDFEEVTLNKGDEPTKINVYVKPEDATIKDIVYSSDDESVVTVDKYGNITPVGEGTATVTVASKDDPTKSDTITVTVKVPVKEIGTDRTDITLRTDGKDKIDVTVNEDATNKEVIFESSDESVVKVDEFGNVEAVGEGEATITVTSKDDPSKKVTVSVTVKNPVTEIIVPDELIVELGEEKKLDAEVNEDATNKELIYEAEDADIVKVDNDGNIVAVGEGTTTITITSKVNPEIKETVTVTVVKNYRVTYEIIGDVITDGVSAPGEAIYVNGSDVTVEAVLSADGYTFSGWSTDDVTVEDGKFVINKDVHFVGSFEKIKVDEIVIDKTVIELEPGKTDKITVTVTPEDALDKKVIFESGDESIVKVDEDGNITAVGEGETVITVYPNDDPDKKIEIPVKIVKNYKVTYEIIGDVIPDGASAPDEAVYANGSDVTVEAVLSADGYTFSGWLTDDVTVEDGKFVINKDVHFVGSFKKNVKEITVVWNNPTLEPGDVVKLPVTVNPDDATNKKVIFESGDESIVKVDEDGNITAVGEGETTVSVRSEDNPDVMVEIPVKVEIPYIPVTGVTINKTEFELAPDDVDKITVTFKPDDATNKEVIFESSDESIVKVDKDGNIEAVGEGEATITVTSKDNPNLKIEVSVKVEKPVVPVTNITVDKTEIELTPDGKDKITVTVKPDDATDKEIIFESSDESIVKVDKDGNIEAVGEGTATITVTSKNNPDLKTTVTVTVKGEEPSDPDEPDVPDEPDLPDEPEYTITVPGSVSIMEGNSEKLDIKITPDDGKIKPVYTSSDESVVKVDADGVITGVGAGTATISVDFGNGDIRLIPITVAAAPAIPAPPRKHHVCFGKTDGIGWYEVSVNGGDFFAQGPNSTLEVEEGSVLVVRVQDMWIDDEFDFYVNGSKVPMDPANTITVVVDGYMLIGALSMDVEVPDVEESVSILDKIANFFAGIINWFRNLFKR